MESKIPVEKFSENSGENLIPNGAQTLSQQQLRTLTELILPSLNELMLEPKRWHSDTDHSASRSMIQFTIYQLIFEV
jgi:hypothetical protein